MERYAPIHPERPILRAAVAAVLSVGVHVAIFALLWVVARAALEELRKAEAARPKEVALARLDAAQWEANRRVPEAAIAPDRAAPPLRTAEARVARGEPNPIQRDGAAGSQAPAPAPAERATSAGPAASAEAEVAPGEGTGTLDLTPRPRASLPLAMRFDPIGAGAGPLEEGTAFSGLTVQTPEAWRYTNFFGRAVEAMNSVYRHEMGAPMPHSLHVQWLANPRAGGGCSATWVTIDAGGRVVDVSVRRSSGMPDLDELIVRVIRRTAPFVNVPTGLLGAGGRYTDTWGLCLAWGRWRG